MPGIRLVTDGASDLTPELIGNLPVTVVPLDVRLGAIGPDETAKMTPAEFWQTCAQTTAIAETSAPSPGAFQEAFLAASRDGADGAVCVTLSSDLSATYQVARAAAAAISDSFHVEVIDSRSVTLGEGFAVLDGARAAAEGASAAEVTAQVTKTLSQTIIMGTLDTLENLRRGGRIGSAQAFFGSLLSLKPVIVVRDGVVEGESRQRTRRRSLEYVAEKVAAQGPFKRVAVLHAGAGDVEAFVDLVARFAPRETIIVAYIGPVVGAHAGPGTVAICAERS